jgi:transmembrane sensor
MRGTRFEQEEFPLNPIEQQAAQFIERRDCAVWSSEDQAELEGWVAASPAHRIAYLRLDAGWKHAERLAALRPRERSLRRHVSLRAAGTIAAALGFLACIGGGVAYYSALPKFSTYATRVGERETLTLRDGSRVELNTNTVIQISDDLDRRHIRLERGEAFFDVVHDKNNPFVVSAGAGKVTDIGTKFVVRRDNERIRVIMLQGVARFDGDANGTQKSIVLRAGDDMLASAEGISLGRKSIGETARETSWRHGVLIFNETPLAEVAAEFNRYNRTKLVIGDPAAAKMEIGGTFAAANVEGFARVAQLLTGLRFENRGDEIVISH